MAQTPNDARLHIVLARADLASGHPGAAEGSLQRATALGAPKEEIAGDLSRVLLAKGEPQRVLNLVGDVDAWPQERRLILALSKAEAALALTNYDTRDLTKSFVDAFRLRATAQADGALADLAWFDQYMTELRSKQAAVEGGHQHFACEREPGADAPPSTSGAQAARLQAVAFSRSVPTRL